MPDNSNVDNVIYVVYNNPSDFPGQHVIRRWRIPVTGDPIPDEAPIVVHPSYAFAVAQLPPGLARIPRDVDLDDPSIVETWL